MFESIPREVRWLCWDYLSVREYGALAMTCHTLQDDRRHLDSTRFVCIASPTNKEALQRSHVLQQTNHPILLRLETPLPSQHVALPAVTELELATRKLVVLAATSFPNVRTVTILHNTKFQDQQQMGRLLQTIETLVIQENDHFYLNGHDLRGCKALHTLILRDCCLQLTEASEDARCQSDFLSWIKAPLRNLTIRNVQCPSQDISQDMLMNFVRRRPQLQYFKSFDLTEANKQRLRIECPKMQIV